MRTTTPKMAEKKAKLWFDKALAELLAEKISLHYEPFDSISFVKEIAEGVEPLELKARLDLFAESLRKHLPENYKKAVEVIVGCLGAENAKETGMFTEFYWVMPFATFVEKHGLDDLATSLHAIAEITKRNTGEFAIRPYLETYPAETFEQMLKWSTHENFHLRRLASEGTRPRLPWARKLESVIEDPRLAIPILETLKDDPIKFVQTSVANHINDMLKDNYDEAMALLSRWKKGAGEERRWIIKHALRKELKKGNPEAIELLDKGTP